MEESTPNIYTLLSTIDVLFSVVFFFNDPATPEIYTLSLHDALPISRGWRAGRAAPHPARVPTGSRAPSGRAPRPSGDRKSTRLNSSHTVISYAVFCLKKKKEIGIRLISIANLDRKNHTTTNNKIVTQ